MTKKIILSISDEEVGNLYISGMSMQDIATSFNTNITKIFRILKKIKISRRSPSVYQALHKKDKNIRWKGFKEISMSFWRRIKQNAITRKIEFNITIDSAWNLFINQNRKCILSDMNIYFPESHIDYCIGNVTASLDRIDSKISYINTNIQWVHKDINCIKRGMDQNKFLNLCKLVTMYQIKSDNNFEDIIDNIVQISGRKLADIKNAAKVRNLDFLVSKEYLLELIKSQHYTCKLTGLPLGIRRGETGSLDRIDSSKPYIEGNLQWVHKEINMMKSTYSNEYFIDLCTKVTNYQKGDSCE